MKKFSVDIERMDNYLNSTREEFIKRLREPSIEVLGVLAGPIKKSNRKARVQSIFAKVDYQESYTPALWMLMDVVDDFGNSTKAHKLSNFESRYFYFKGM